MIRAPHFGLGLLALVLLAPATASARPSAGGRGASHSRRPLKKASAPAAGKPNLVATFGAWGAYVAPGKDKTCYVLAQPQTRSPATLKRDPAYVFISTRPAEHVRNEVSIVEGFDVKEDSAEPANARIGTTTFPLVAKGADLWIKDDTQQGQMIVAMKKSGQMVIKAMSLKGNVTTDTYSLDGLTQALDHVLRACR